MRNFVSFLVYTRATRFVRMGAAIGQSSKDGCADTVGHKTGWRRPYQRTHREDLPLATYVLRSATGTLAAQDCKMAPAPTFAKAAYASHVAGSFASAFPAVFANRDLLAGSLA